MAVTDESLRVHGLTGLRVAGVELVPPIPSGNTGAPVTIVGKRAAAMIRKDAGAETGAGAAA